MSEKLISAERSEAGRGGVVGRASPASPARLCRPWAGLASLGLGVAILVTGCRSTQQWRQQADERATALLSRAQEQENGRSEPIVVESAADSLRRRLLLDQHLQTASPASQGIRDLADNERWQSARHLREGAAYEGQWKSSEPVRPTLVEALQIAAHNSREFQDRKDQLFQTALALDLEDDAFRNTFRGMLDNTLSSTHDGNRRNTGLTHDGGLGFTRTFKNGVELVSSISVDLVKMLSGGKDSSWGFTGDASVTVPLLRGSGEFIVSEPLTQAERNLLYAVRDFEQYKRDFVVRIASSYLSVLQSAQRVVNQEENYKRVVLSTRRSRRMADAGLMPEYQFDQAVQDELNARNSWINARESYANTLDSFRILLGLPPDAEVIPRQDELQGLQKRCEALLTTADVTDYSGKVPEADAPVILKEPDNQHVGPNEIELERAIRIALTTRPDLRNYLDRIEDAQRKVLIAEDSLRAELSLGGRAAVGEGRSLGQAGMDDGDFRLSAGSYSSFLYLDLPFERTRERNNYRNSLISLEKAVRSFQGYEDSIKQSVRAKLRNLQSNRSSLIIQWQAVSLAERRVKSTDLLLKAGRAEIRDVLEAQNALLSAQNSLNSAVVSYRTNELEFQRELGVLAVDVNGRWQELDLREP
ncbi:MAG: TolC family protein [Lentisphaeria bacterium]|jgi:outer membrane protein TolC